MEYLQLEKNKWEKCVWTNTNVIKEYKPDIVIITGHDAYLRKKSDNINDLKNYKNSGYFVKAVKAARNYEKVMRN